MGGLQGDATVGGRFEVVYGGHLCRRRDGASGKRERIWNGTGGRGDGVEGCVGEMGGCEGDLEIGGGGGMQFADCVSERGAERVKGGILVRAIGP